MKLISTSSDPKVVLYLLCVLTKPRAMLLVDDQCPAKDMICLRARIGRGSRSFSFSGTCVAHHGR